MISDNAVIRPKLIWKNCDVCVVRPVYQVPKDSRDRTVIQVNQEILAVPVSKAHQVIPE